MVSYSLFTFLVIFVLTTLALYEVRRTPSFTTKHTFINVPVQVALKGMHGLPNDVAARLLDIPACNKLLNSNVSENPVTVNITGTLKTTPNNKCRLHNDSIFRTDLICTASHEGGEIDGIEDFKSGIRQSMQSRGVSYIKEGIRSCVRELKREILTIDNNLVGHEGGRQAFENRLFSTFQGIAFSIEGLDVIEKREEFSSVKPLTITHLILTALFSIIITTILSQIRQKIKLTK